jgi:hypothetical protein
VLEVPVLVVLNDAVTPVGTPDAARLTVPLPVARLTTPMVVLALLPPGIRVRLLGEEVRLKFDPGTVSDTGAVVTAVPEVPVMVNVDVPDAAVLLALRISKLMLLVLGGLKKAVTPLGSPETLRLTLPVRLVELPTMTTMPMLAPGARVTLLMEVESVKLDAPLATCERINP